MSIEKHILIIDDNEGLCYSLRNIFEDEGYRVTVAHTGADGLAALHRGPADVTLLDIHLPDAQGTELLPAIHELQPDMPVIVITAYGSLDTAVQALNLGAFAYVLKPLDMDEVLVVVRRALEKLRLVQQERRLTRQLRALNRAALVMTSELEPDRVLQTITDLARELVSATYAALAVPGEDGNVAQLYTAGLAEEQQAAPDDLPQGQNLISYLLRQAKPTRLDDLHQHPHFASLLPHHPDVTSFLGVPIVSRGRVLGLLCLADKISTTGAIGPFNGEDQQVIETLAAQAAVAIENARLYEAERQWAAELMRAAEQLEQELTERVQAEAALRESEEALRESEERYRTLIENQGEGAGIVDPEERFIFANPAAESIFGVPCGGLVGRNLREFTDPEQFARVREQTEKRRSGDKSTYELDIVRLDGERGTVLITATPQFDSEGQFVGTFGVFRDITERKRIEKQLHLQATALDAAANGIVITDREGIILWANPAFTELTGYTVEEAVGQNPRLLKSGQHDQAFYQRLWETILSGQAWHGEIVNRRKDGSLYTEEMTITPVRDEHGQDSRFIAIKQDVTERVQAEEALRQQTHKLDRRVRELNCLYSISGLIERPSLSLNELLQQVVDLIPSAWPHPNLTGARVVLEDQETGTENFDVIVAQDSPSLSEALKQTADITVYGRRVGIVEVCHLGPASDGTGVARSEIGHSQGSVTDLRPSGEVSWEEERNLLKAIARQLGVAAERKAAADQLRHAATHDALTGLANRALFTEHLERSVRRAKPDREPVKGASKRRVSNGYLFAVLFIDLDHFKVVNDSLGHLTGDQLLTTIAHRLKSCLRPADTIARLGGDEFAILLEGIQDIDEARRIAERLQEKIAAPISLDTKSAGGQEAFTTASIGIASNAIAGYDHPANILRDADTALYKAKAQGRARYVIFDASMHSQAIARWQLEADLRQAVERAEFQLHYQPIVSLSSGRIVGVEALLRWQHPERGLVPPEEFIPLAEETGLILSIGEWVLRTACAQARDWHAAGFDFLRLTVNVSASQFSAPALTEQRQNLPDLVKAALAETGLPARALELEITESIALGRAASTENDDFALAALNELRAMGVRISIDDFGLGSSLGHLKFLPLDSLKIAQSFVEGMTNRGDEAAIITAMITMAHSLNLKVIAEGVEREEQLAFLRAQGCDEIQGYLFSPPVPAEDLTEMLQAGQSLAPGSLDEKLEALVYTQTARRRKLAYALADEQLTILANNAALNQWVEGQPYDLVGQSLPEVFPELVGAEDVLYRIARDQKETLTISKIYRPAFGEDGPGRYFDLQIKPFLEAGRTESSFTLLVIVTDVTEQARLEQRLRQERNVLRLNIPDG